MGRAAKGRVMRLPSARALVDSVRTGWFRGLRRRALTLVAAIVIAAVAAASLTALPTWPVVGVAFLAVATAVNAMASRLQASGMTCLECAADISGQPGGTHGTICHACGAINQPYVVDVRAADGRDEDFARTFGEPVEKA